ncbi:MAG TPA: hypothetical protein VFV51_10585, partial [Vicinamibacterales bacterium]|nr:hypothetical protein [Vicinamibacterales bacterium]
MKKFLVLVCAVSVMGQAASPKSQASSAFELTVDSIMRGPQLVGNPPNNLRWSGDSKELYFEWLMPKEDQPATWVVSRDGGTPKRLSEAERRNAPLVNGQWDAARRRILGTDRGDIVVIDTVARKRIEITRTTAAESSPRWARGETHVTFVRDNNLFIVPVESVQAGALVQLTDVAVRRTDPRTTDSQKFLKEEEARLLDWVEEEAARRKRREALDKARALPKFELADRQTIADAAVSADGRFAFLVMNERAQSRASQVPRYVSESAFTEEINARTKVGDAQDRRRLAILHLETGDAFWAGLDGVSDPIAIPKPPFGDEPRPASKPEPAPKRDVRWG